MIGTDSFSAFWKSLSIVLLNSCVALAKPNSATVNAGARLLQACDSVEQRLHTRVGGVQLSLHVELDQLRVPVLRDLAGRRRCAGSSPAASSAASPARSARSSGTPGQRRFASPSGRCTLSAAGVSNPALVKELLRTSRFARRLLGRGQRVRADRHAESDRDYNERDPDGDRGLPMIRTPTSCARGKVVAVHERLPLLGLRTGAARAAADPV